MKGFNASILKRIQIVESKVNVSHCPDLIMIDYEEECGGYRIKETYMNPSGWGAKEKTHIVENMDKYMFPPGFDGTCIMDLFGAPVANPNLYVFSGKEVRREEHIPKEAGFCMVMAEVQEEEMKAQFEVTKV